METKDLIVIGGGINGAGIAADAAGRGLSVLMLEARDLACATSSASSKLIHGGLRYLEHYEFRLVSEALAEREVLLKMAPHIAFPMRFRLPHRPHLRPAWMIRIAVHIHPPLRFEFVTLWHKAASEWSHSAVTFTRSFSPIYYGTFHDREFAFFCQCAKENFFHRICAINRICQKRSGFDN